ncbi:MAG: amidohydrolase [SAR202 cluster bacterium]|nr:amidohydrolase [SAR202 cluster bacterium]
MDAVLLGGNILTMDRSKRRVQALAVRGGKIAAVGPTGEIARLATPKTKVVNLNGRTVTPGFMDPHNHFSMTTWEPVSVDCRVPPLRNKKAVLDAIAAAAAAAPTGKWIWGQAYSFQVFEEAGVLTKGELDEAGGDHPVCIMDFSYHALYANSAALKLAGITKNTPDPRGGVIVRDASGQPNGFLQERAMDLVHKTTMRAFIDLYGEDAVADLVYQNSMRHLEHGVTSLGDAQTMPESGEMYRIADKRGKLPICVRQLRGGDTFFGAPERASRGEFGKDTVSDRLRGGTMKIFMDPVFPNFGLYRCHPDGKMTPEGEVYYTQDEVDQLVLNASKNGLQVAIHCIGNRAIEQGLNALERSVREVKGSDKLRHRIDHFSFPTNKQIQRIAKSPFIISQQPAFIYNIGHMFEQTLKDYNIDAPAAALASMVDAGATIAAGSDFPCASIAPLDGIAASAGRRHISGRQIAPEQAISAEESIRQYTNGSAYVLFRENEVGSLEVGKQADMVVLSHDPTAVHPDHIRGVVVEQTYVNGDLKFKK